VYKWKKYTTECDIEEQKERFDLAVLAVACKYNQDEFITLGRGNQPRCDQAAQEKYKSELQSKFYPTRFTLRMSLGSIILKVEVLACHYTWALSMANFSIPLQIEVEYFEHQSGPVNARILSIFDAKNAIISGEKILQFYNFSSCRSLFKFNGSLDEHHQYIIFEEFTREEYLAHQTNYQQNNLRINQPPLILPHLNDIMIFNDDDNTRK